MFLLGFVFLKHSSHLEVVREASVSLFILLLLFTPLRAVLVLTIMNAFPAVSFLYAYISANKASIDDETMNQ